MYGFTYTLCTQEPVLANAIGGDPNSAQSLPFIPGALVRGALIRLYQEDKKLTALDAGDADSEVRRLFFNDQTRYLHAYPVVDSDIRRALPAPLGWQTYKRLEAGESVNDRVLFDLSYEKRNSNKQLTGVDNLSFCTLIKNEQAYYTNYPDHINVHTQRDAVAGRAKEGQGAVYRYEALPAGHLFKGIVITSTPEDAELLKTLLSGKTFTAGKARTAGYGKVSVIDADELGEMWSELPDPGGEDEYVVEGGEDQLDEVEMEPAIAAKEFTLTLLSEILVRDEHGQHTLDLVPALERRFNQPESGKKYSFKLNTEKTFRKPTIVGGFNRKWGLPLPQTTAIAAGSVFKLTVSPPLEDHELKSLEESGLGERRLDGFGRIAVNWYSTPPERWVKDDSGQAERPIIPAQDANEEITKAERKLGELMLQRLLRRDLDSALLTAIQGLKLDRAVPNSQLARWRAVIYQAWSEATPDLRLSRVSEFITREAGELSNDPTRKEGRSSSGWEKMHRARIGAGENKKRLTEWIRDLLQREGHDWNWLTKEANALTKSFGSTLSQSTNWEMHVEYRLRLIDGVLARAAKGDIDKTEKGGPNG
ncbi:MAG: hypothetical protein JNJ50_19830 [Acidobacteria bacterium]|nr:hypothetical protein [Acidobacteriota bacterium]